MPIMNKRFVIFEQLCGKYVTTDESFNKEYGYKVNYTDDPFKAKLFVSEDEALKFVRYLGRNTLIVKKAVLVLTNVW